MGILDTIAPGKKNRSQEMTSTQAHLRIGEIRDDVVVLKNGGMRAVIKTSSINFNLKSEEEQQAIIYSYQAFLNSLEFPVQILVRSKKLNIDDYIDQVKKLGEKQENSLLQEQTYEYADYIKRLVEYADIMEKSFYVVIPYDPSRAVKSGLGIQDFFQRLSPKDTVTEAKKRYGEFDQVKKTLSQRINTVSAGLQNCGLQTEALATQELIELFYESYNPKIYRTAKLQDVADITIKTDEKEEK
ncbi:hypothetical protein HN709_01985 [Candidatus Peregrinibacteria bacterium]|jgi:hypothetical protein|nr:hypothetical protein [Candidatus Peregrinibacteria bacterium]MBT7736432.1 hypothetical protein [Candidatus Peregrinibacteria bacterium]